MEKKFNGGILDPDSIISFTLSISFFNLCLSQYILERIAWEKNKERRSKQRKKIKRQRDKHILEGWEGVYILIC